MKSLKPFIIIGVAVAVLYMYTWPQWKSVAVLRTRSLDLQTALSQAQELSQLRDSLLSQYTAISPSDTEKISKVVPEKYDPVKLVTDINAVAVKYGMLVKGVNLIDVKADAASGVVQAEQPVEPYKKRGLSFTTEGQYKNFTAFLSDLEKSLQLLDIQNVEIIAKQKSEKGGTDTLSFKVTLVTYWMN